MPGWGTACSFSGELERLRGPVKWLVGTRTLRPRLGLYPLVEHRERRETGRAEGVCAAMIVIRILHRLLWIGCVAGAAALIGFGVLDLMQRLGCQRCLP